jgi:excisionase family DNA binding protein
VSEKRTGHTSLAEPLTYSPREIAEMLSVEPKTPCRWAERGLFPRPIRIGRTTRWPRRTVDEFLAQRGLPAAPARGEPAS